MPYIRKSRREQLNSDHNYKPLVAGELNYKITQLFIEYLDRNGLSYQTINDILGAVESAKLEFNRRVVSNYEDQKIKDNGDVYPKEFI